MIISHIENDLIIYNLPATRTFVVAVEGNMRPGGFDSLETALAAARLPYAVLKELAKAVPGRIILEEVAVAAKVAAALEATA